MTEIEQEIEDAIKDLQLPPESAVRCGYKVAAQVVQKAMGKFVEGNPRSWWLSLKQTPEQAREYYADLGDDAYRHIADYIPTRDERCWLIPETEEETAEQTLPVFEVETRSLSAILEHCGFFEYYLVGLSFDWLVIENDHNSVVVVHDRANRTPT